MELHGKYTVFAEGARGHLGKQLIARSSSTPGATRRATPSASRSCGKCRPDKAKPGLVVHTAGWPMDNDTYGGGFLYHLDGNKVTLGFVIGLDYQNPWLSPFEEMQRWKTHPAIRAHIEGGKRIGYGARAITAGGLLSLPKTGVPRRRAGRLRRRLPERRAHQGQPRGDQDRHAGGRGRVRRRSPAGRQHDELTAYPEAFEQSWLHDELRPGAQLQAVVQEGQLRRHADDRHRAVAAAQARHQEPAVDDPPQQARPRCT